MKLFKRGKDKDDSQPKVKTGGMALPVSLIQSQDESYALAFGMRWRTLLKSGGRDASVNMARAAKATHFVHLSQQVGYGVFSKQKAKDLYPAAMMAAKINAGVGLFCLTLGEGLFWICVVRNGFPTAADDIIQGAEADATQRMRQILAQFADESITVYSDIRHAGITGLHEFSLYDLFDVAKTSSDLIHVLPKAGSRIPVPIMLAVVIGTGLLLGQKFWNDYKKSEKLRQIAMLKSQDEDPIVAWAPVLRKFLADNVKADNSSLVKVRGAISDLPAMWQGWWLTGARCQASETMVDGKKNWACTANYKRTPVGPVSSSMEKVVKQLMPASSVSFPDISNMSVSWAFAVSASPLTLDSLITPESQTLTMISALQPLSPLLAMQPDFKMTPLELPAPKMSDGKTYPKPDSIPDFFTGQVLLKGPLRSLDLAVTKLPAVDWRAIGIQFDEKASPSAKGLTASSLMAELDGRILAKKGGTQ